MNVNKDKIYSGSPCHRRARLRPLKILLSWPIDKEGSLLHYVSDVGHNAYLYSHGAFLWSLEKHLPDVALMIFHHGEVAWTSVYKFHDWSMGRGDSLLNTDNTYDKLSWNFIEQVLNEVKLLANFSPNHVSFVPGRHKSDNIMIAQELLQKCKNSKGVKGFMAWKVDLSKAYDKLSWNFIEQVLNEVKLPANFVKIIMSCVSTASYQIIVNEELSNSFSGSRGIRQGDPLSPYLFVLCMEKLSHSIQTVVEMGHWKPIQSSQSGPHISHLFFADDLILFSEASSTQAIVMKEVMNLFCSLSGQSVSFEKSMVYCSPNVRSSLAKNISRICGSSLTADLGVYLGMPLIHSRVSASTYVNLVDKVQSRLASWKSKTLNMTDLVKKGIQWRVGNGCTTKLWTDKWSPCGILENLALNHDVIDLHAVVKEFWIGRLWNVDMLMVHLPTDVVHVITTIPIAVGDLQDKIIWGKTSSGIFSVKSAYQLICDESGYQKYVWMKNWSMHIPPKLKIFLWTFVSSKLLTNVQRSHRRLIGNSSCKHCAGVPETMLHLFRDCPKARLIWSSFNIPANMLATFTSDWDG
ncbi:hypothetical protein ACLB2K_059786 [Fragaria x ananassa]